MAPVRKEENGHSQKVSLNLIGPVIPNAEKMLLIGLKSKQTWWLMPQVQQNKNNSFFEGLSVRGAYYPKVLNAPVYPNH